MSYPRAFLSSSIPPLCAYTRTRTRTRTYMGCLTLTSETELGLQKNKTKKRKGKKKKETYQTAPCLLLARQTTLNIPSRNPEIPVIIRFMWFLFFFLPFLSPVPYTAHTHTQRTVQYRIGPHTFPPPPICANRGRGKTPSPAPARSTKKKTGCYKGGKAGEEEGIFFSC